MQYNDKLMAYAARLRYNRVEADKRRGRVSHWSSRCPPRKSCEVDTILRSQLHSFSPGGRSAHDTMRSWSQVVAMENCSSRRRVRSWHCKHLLSRSPQCFKVLKLMRMKRNGRGIVCKRWLSLMPLPLFIQVIFFLMPKIIIWSSDFLAQCWMLGNHLMPS